MTKLLEHFPTVRLLGLDLVAAHLPETAVALSARPAGERFGYVVTPNADHFVRLHGAHAGNTSTGAQPGKIANDDLYRSAGALLLDSRVVYTVARLLGLRPPPVVTGSDLTATLLSQWIDTNERVTIVGTTRDAVARLQARYGLTNVAHHCPPFGFERDPALVEACAEYVEANPARFVLLACGAPRQEILAHRIAQRGRATGIGLCIGSAVDQLGGHEVRAPAWMRHNGLEWAWRLARAPSRMGARYWADIGIFSLLFAETRQPRPPLDPGANDAQAKDAQLGEAQAGLNANHAASNESTGSSTLAQPLPAQP
jgi:N-acetylglucosaminyldiphosphoundecaprenol N-acetyl-beta-D-mannosaminyltransferase